MIIDAHCHVWTWDIVPDSYWDELAKIVIDFFRKNNLGSPSVDEVKKNVMDPMMDPDGSKLIANMDASGVDKAFIMALDWGYGIGEARKTVDEINQFYGSIAKNYPDRVVAFAGVDPRRPGAVDILDRAVNDYGCRGLKYHPTSGFYPDSEESYKVLEKAQSLGIPLLSHMGPISKPLKSKYARPIYLDTIVSDFPKLTVIGAHMSFCWWREFVNIIAAKATTLYADFSGHQVTAKRNFSEFCHMMRDAFDEATAEKFLWGTDNPVLEAVIPMKDWLKMIKDLPENAPDGLKFTKEEIDAVLGENAAKIIEA
ncbi:MAG: amidohydrolase family protein [Deltaproteobacteria bacterium]|nr:amidohydrolase family protein [Deltaproteobacteria bacterium]